MGTYTQVLALIESSAALFLACHFRTQTVLASLRLRVGESHSQGVCCPRMLRRALDPMSVSLSGCALPTVTLATKVEVADDFLGEFNGVRNLHGH